MSYRAHHTVKARVLKHSLPFTVFLLGEQFKVMGSSHEYFLIVSTVSICV